MGLFVKTDVIHPRGSWRVFDVAYAALEWVACFSTPRLPKPVEYV